MSTSGLAILALRGVDTLAAATSLTSTADCKEAIAKCKELALAAEERHLAIRREEISQQGGLLGSKILTLSIRHAEGPITRPDEQAAAAEVFRM